MSEWIDNFVKQLENEITERQVVINAIKPPKEEKPKRRRRRRRKAETTIVVAASPEQRELQANLRTSMVGMRPTERKRLLNGELEVAHVTTGGNQDG